VAGDRVVVLGATGYTGRLIARALHAAEVPVLLAGRQAEKLRALAGELGGVPTLVADVHDQPQLDALAQRAQVLVNCVGPFLDHGEPVVRAAIAAGAHYLDTTGEQPFMKAMLIHDTWARTQRVAVVSACAFEVAVADCGAALAAAGFDAVEGVDVTYAVRFQPSRGTQRSVLRMLQSSAYAYEGGQWVDAASAPQSIEVDFPEPIGRVTAVSFPSAEVLTVPRHVTTRAVRTYLSVPRLAAPLLGAALPVVRLAARSPLGGLAAQLLGEATDGPDEQTRRHQTFHILVEARGLRPGAAVCQRLVLRGADPYGLTAAIIREATLRLLDPRFDRSGVLPPAAAFDPRDFLDALKAERVSAERLAD
jgi:short subunit dehydrogenase-like uncharacterized protein